MQIKTNTIFQKFLIVLSFAAALTCAQLLSDSAAFATNTFVGNYSSITIHRYVGTNPYDSGFSGIQGNLPVTNDFTYTIEQVVSWSDSTSAASTNGATATGYPISATISFTNTTIHNGYASASAQVDFSNTVFPEIGLYAFKITETTSSNSALYPVDSSTQYLILAEVSYAVDSNNNTIWNSMVVDLKQRPYDLSTNAKSSNGYIWYSYGLYSAVVIFSEQRGNYTEDLSNQSATQCFEYGISISPGGLVSNGDTFKAQAFVAEMINGNYILNIPSHCYQNGATDYTITVGSSTPATVRLAHSEALLMSLPVGTSYTITATDGPNSFLVAVDGGNYTVTKTLHQIQSAQDIINDISHMSTSFAFTDIIHTRDLTPFSGIFTNIWLYIALLATVAVGVIFIAKRSKQHNNPRKLRIRK